MASYAYDVAIVGGGPAGSAAAISLAREGRQVLVIEGEGFPRPHVGESTLLSIHSSLRWLGVAEKVEAAGFRHKTGATCIWGMSREPWSFYFREVDDSTGWRKPYSYEIERDIFDKILLDHAIEHGAELRMAQVADFVVEDGAVQGVRLGDGEVIRARMVLDASGQKCLAGRRFGWREMNPRLRNAAIYGYWKGGPPKYERLGTGLTDDDQSNILICSMPWGWLWMIPLRGDKVSIGCVLAGGSDRPPVTTLQETYLKMVGGCEAITCLLADLEWDPAEPVRSVSDWSYYCRRFTMPGLFVAGDAACFADPILSSGLHLALRGAASAACAIHSILNGMDEELVRHWYESTYLRAYQDYEAMALWWYHGDCNRESWYRVAESLIDPQLYGKDLSGRKAFVSIASGLQPLPYVTVDAAGPGCPIKMVSLFHLNAAYTPFIPRLREKFGVSEIQSEAVEQEPVESVVAGEARGPRFGPGVALALEPDPERCRVGMFAYPPDISDPSQRIEVTDFWSVLRLFDGRRTLAEIAGGLGLDAEEQEGLHRLALQLQARGVLDGVPAREAGQASLSIAAEAPARPTTAFA